MSEKCDRCQKIGEDRRTLWMACFYRMDELGLPFEEVKVHGVQCAKTGNEETTFGKMPLFAEPAGEPHDYRFYLLRVCKRCRGEWMAAIKDWFHQTPEGDDHDADDYNGGSSPVGSGIFIRENGSIKEISQEEWDRRVKAKW